MELRLGGDFFQLGQKIGAGASGSVHIATNLRTGEEVAVKLEPLRTQHQRLVYEAMVHKLLDGSPGIGIPAVRWYGIVGDLSVMVMDLLGPSLEDILALRRARGRKGLGLQAVLRIAEQVLDRLEFVHSRNFVHRDIKPDNFLVGFGEALDRVHIIDFGVAKKYRDPKTLQHIPETSYRDPRQIVGNAGFSSLAADAGCEQSRRDDLEAVGYMLVYLLRGRLPWLPRSQSERPSWWRKRSQSLNLQEVAQAKKSTSLEVLCRRCPEEFLEYFRYCRSLAFHEQPDYVYLRQLLRKASGSSEALEVAPKPSMERWLADGPSHMTEAAMSKSPSIIRKEHSGDGTLGCPCFAGTEPRRSFPALLGTFWRGAPQQAQLISDGYGEASCDNPIVDNPIVEPPGNPVVEALSH